MTVVNGANALVRMALAEDLGERGDVTSLATLAAGTRAQAQIVTKAAGVLAGLQVVAEVFREMDTEIRLRLRAADGKCVQAGELLCELEGRAVALLGAERTALNFLQHLSGIAHADAALCRRGGRHGRDHTGYAQDDARLASSGEVCGAHGRWLQTIATDCTMR